MSSPRNRDPEKQNGARGRGGEKPVKPLPVQQPGVKSGLLSDLHGPRGPVYLIMASIKSSLDPLDTDKVIDDKNDPKKLKQRGINGEKSQGCCEKICEEAYRAGVRDGVNSASKVWNRLYEVYSFVAISPLQRFVFGSRDDDTIRALVARLPTGIRAPVEIRPAYGLGYIEGVTISPDSPIPSPTEQNIAPGDSEAQLPVVLDSEDPETLVIGYSEFFETQAFESPALIDLFAPQPKPLPAIAQAIMPRIRVKLRKKFPCRPKCGKCTRDNLWGQSKPRVRGKFVSIKGEIIDEKRKIRQNPDNS